MRWLFKGSESKVFDDDEVAQAELEGWGDTPTSTALGDEGELDNNVLPEEELATLRAKGKALKIKSAHNMGIDKLKEAIARKEDA